MNCPTEDVTCLGACSRLHHENMLTCPCQSGCPNGCPCNDYVCPTTTPSTTTLTTTTAPANTDVLILNNYKSKNVPVVTNAAGLDDRDISFEFEDNTEVFSSCGLTFRNHPIST